MNTHNTKVSVDTARLLIIDPVILGTLTEQDIKTATDTAAATGFAKIGPHDVGLLIGCTGYGDGTYPVTVETFDDDGLRVAKVTIDFTRSYLEATDR